MIATQIEPFLKREFNLCVYRLGDRLPDCLVSELTAPATSSAALKRLGAGGARSGSAERISLAAALSDGLAFFLAGSLSALCYFEVALSYEPALLGVSRIRSSGHGEALQSRPSNAAGVSWTLFGEAMEKLPARGFDARAEEQVAALAVKLVNPFTAALAVISENDETMLQRSILQTAESRMVRPSGSAAEGETLASRVTALLSEHCSATTAGPAITREALMQP